jgi:KDO2-lipid IV(A) lauroyltransferase
MIEKFAYGIINYFRSLPREKALKRGEQIGKLLWLLRYRRKVIFTNLDIAFPEKDLEWKKDIAKKSTIHIGRILAEFPKLPDYYKTGEIGKIFKIIKGKEILEKYRNDGFLFTSAHLGNWELLLSGLAYNLGEMYTLAYRQENELAYKITKEIRTGYGINVIHHNESMKKVFKAIKEHKPVGFFVDQNTMRKRGIFVDFFGKPAITVDFAARLAVKFQKPVLFIYCYMDYKDKNYYCEVEEVKWEEGNTVEETEYNIVQAYTKKVEEAVRKHPDQYLWVHKRWRTRPTEEEPSPYGDLK